MIYYPIQTLVNAGITDIMIVTGGNSAGDFLKLLGNGKAFGLKHLNYTYQEGEGGIAEALSLVEHFAAKEPVCVVLGDNIIEGNIAAAVRAYQRARQRRQDYFEEECRIRSALAFPNSAVKTFCVSKRSPQQPKSEYAVIGIYMYDGEVFDIIRTLEAFRPRRTGNYRRQQRLHQTRRDDLGRTRWLVDRCRNL